MLSTEDPPLAPAHATLGPVPPEPPHDDPHTRWQHRHGLTDLSKFDPRQPRAPRGSGNGGQWVAGGSISGGKGPTRSTGGGGGGGGAITSADQAAQRLMTADSLTDPDKIRRAAKRIRMFGQDGWRATASTHNITPTVTHQDVADRLDQLADTYTEMMAIRAAINRPTGD